MTSNVRKAVTINLYMEGISKYLKELVYGRSQFMHQFPEHPVRPIIPGALTSGGHARAVYSLPANRVLSFCSGFFTRIVTITSHFVDSQYSIKGK